MARARVIRKGDGFLDDLINLFFLRPVSRQSAEPATGDDREEQRDDH